VRAGTEGQVNVTSVLVSNEAYVGSVVIRLQTAPADRNSDVTWTTLETRTLPPIALADLSETMYWSVTVLNQGEYDIRLTADSDDSISERDEANNDAYMVVQGATPKMVGLVPSFAPTMLMTALVGLYIGLIISRAKPEIVE
jgi:hypothetical protein